MILDLLLLTRHLPSLQSETTSPSKSDAKLWPQSPLLAADLLDTLFVVLVDSPKNLKTFEDTGGLEIVRKVLKSKNVGKQVRYVQRPCRRLPWAGLTLCPPSRAQNEVPRVFDLLPPPRRLGRSYRLYRLPPPPRLSQPKRLTCPPRPQGILSTAPLLPSS